MVNKADFVKAMKNIKNHEGIKLATNEVRINYLLSEPKYYTRKSFLNIFSNGSEKKTYTLGKPVYLGL